jgi:hypothetical protein
VFLSGWRQNTIGEYACEEFDGAKVLRVSNISGDPSGYIRVRLEADPTQPNRSSAGLSLEAGKVYRLRVEYRMPSGGTGLLSFQDPKYVKMEQKSLTPTDGAWGWVELVIRRDGDPLSFALDNHGPGPENTILVRRMELTEAPAGSASP